MALFDMVKLALIENIAYLCKRIRFCIKEYEYAHKYAALCPVSGRTPSRCARRYCATLHAGVSIRRLFQRFLGQVKHEGRAGARITTIVDEALHRRGLDSRQVVLTNRLCRRATRPAWRAVFGNRRDGKHGPCKTV